MRGQFACLGEKTFWNSALWLQPLATQVFALLFRSGAPGRIRTHDPQIRSLVLYPTELPALAMLVAV